MKKLSRIRSRSYISRTIKATPVWFSLDYPHCSCFSSTYPADPKYFDHNNALYNLFVCSSHSRRAHETFPLFTVSSATHLRRTHAHTHTHTHAICNWHFCQLLAVAGLSAFRFLPAAKTVSDCSGHTAQGYRPEPKSLPEPNPGSIW